ncbi:MAG: metallophosphoesterase family protein [Bacteroidetes bacterium]|nr:metallophosphoesterase family protein [Bacteroidota bacterium]
MKNNLFIYVITFLLLGSGCKKEYTPVSMDKIRLSWNYNPATTITIGWDQIGGENPKVYYGTKDKGKDWKKYKYSQKPTREVNELNMKTRFCELNDLLPNTAYYFVIKDSEWITDRYWFKTAPDKPEPFTCIVGGDTKSVEPSLSAGRYSNQMVSKLRPLFVLFCGDFTSYDATDPDHWALWLSDWFELTKTEDGRLFPIIPVMGNHERKYDGILNVVFNTPYQHDDPNNSYYSLSFGGNFVHITALNSELWPIDQQTDWLERDLKSAENFTFKFAAYHKPFRPHTIGKRENMALYYKWAYLFNEYGLDISIDADSHMSKITFPVVPDSINGYEAFVRDDLNGTMYIGEGSWGAGHRDNDDDKPWTLRSGSFNQFKWLHVFPKSENEEAHVDIRTVITSIRDSTKTSISHVEGVTPLSEGNVFAIPEGVNLFSTEPYGEVITYPFVDKKK